MNRPLRIGLTGGIGSGKSTVAGLFADLGVPVFDADHIARELTARGQPALLEIRAVFGDSILAPDKTLDRSRLRERIFSNPEERRQLEAILHPRVYHTLELLTEQQADSPYVVWVVPLLLETGADGRVDRVLVIDCAEDLQASRAAARDGIDMSLVKQIIAQQMPRSERLSRADDILENDGSLDNAEHQVKRLHKSYRQLVSDRAPGGRHPPPE